MMRERLLLALCSFLLCAELISCNPVKTVTADDDVKNYRLPGDVIPVRYDIQLTVKEDFMVSEKFTGTVAIEIIPTVDGVKSITLNAAYISMAQTHFSLKAKEQAGVLQLEGYTEDAEVEQVTVTLVNALVKDTAYILTITDYEGVLHGDMYGFYLSSYTNADGGTEWIATTQLQSTYARRAFPCFDEPAFKAIFALTITRPAGYNSLSNTKQKAKIPKAEGELESDVYEDTPIMSSYLIAFIVSKFKPFGPTEEVYNVWSREEALPTASYSYEVGPKLLEALDKYTNYKYYDNMKINKMDQVAIPDFAAGAMENWGLVTYRETALLWDPNESTADYKQRVATVIAHEFAHMWFGNLVTLEFWTHTWLNEGFARYFQYFITAEVEDTWELEKQFVIQQQQVIFGSDALTGALPLSSEVSTPSEISNKFASISYNKGASVIRMMKNMLGDAKFQEGLQLYLSTNAFGNTVPADLWEPLAPHFDNTAVPTRDFATIMTGWVVKAGFPVVTVTMDGDDAVLSQKRFLLNSEEDETTWDIPITYTISHGPDFENTEVAHWLLSDEDLTIPNILHGEAGWVVVNIQETGYYRVNYDAVLWDALDAGLKANNFDGIHVLNRAQIVDDALNLARAGIITYERALDVTSFLQEETEYYPWYSALNAFAFLRRRLDYNTANGKFLETHILALLDKMYKTVSFDIGTNLGHVDTLKTALVLQWACELKEEECIQKAKEIFDNYKNDDEPVNPNIRSIVYCTAVRDHFSRENWDFLWNKFTSTSLATEQVILLTAMGCANDEDVLKEYLTLSITADSGIRKQDAGSVFTAVLAGTPNGVAVAFEFFQENFSDIVNFYEGMNALSSVINGIADRLTTSEQVAAFKTFINEHKEDLKDAAHQAENAIANAEANIEWVESKSPDLTAWFKATYGGASQITLNISLLLAILSIILYL